MTTANNTSKTVSSTRKVRVTKHDVAVHFLLNGADQALQAMLVDHTNPVKCIDDVIDTIAKREKGNNNKTDVSDLRALRNTFASMKGKGRGASPLRKGTTKQYKAQQVKDQGLFIRLPVDLLVGEKGQQVEVTVSEDGTTLTVKKMPMFG